mmetsp:Transcript_12619/g.14505  ORF Transcript_12619/g.14505 Transcript_12619/m.14505 type:complete len:82 (+) Transcript_12619:392-637(+)
MIAVVHRTKPFKTICFVLICEYASKGNSGVSGTVFFVGGHNLPTKITAEIHGLSKGKHGFHIHEFGNLTEGCKTAGGMMFY